jgi:xanthine dehydrogenase YagR molybdenum-binding subunit
VKIILTRQQMFQLAGQRPATQQRMRFAAKRDGELTAIGHDVIMKVSTHSDYAEAVAGPSRDLYAAPNRKTSHRTVALHVPGSEDVRAPGDAPGLLVAETAFDELAHALAIDPIELRVKNEPALHPERNVPFSQRRLVDCYREGARRFGWDRRPQVPGTRRDGQWLIGYGVATAIRGHFQAETSVRVKLDAAGKATVESDMTDIGTGTYTILAQLVSEALSLPLSDVRVDIGRSDYPKSPGSGGSWGATNSCSAALAACRILRDKLAATGAGTAIEATGTVPNAWTDPNYMNNALYSYGAQFAEVRVDVDTGEIRLTRMLGVFVAGRMLNPTTARSQLIGGMIWGASNALLEEGVVDPRFGSFINRDLAQYLVPVHADIPEIDAIVLDSFDAKANPLGAKGIGELGICGSGAAVGNAVFNATGVRVRDFPITLEKVLPGLPR